MDMLLIFAGGMIGAFLRYVCSIFYGGWKGKPNFPLIMIIVNITGSFLYGAIGNIPLSDGLCAFLATGCLGSFTTFSTFSLEAVQLYSDQRYVHLAVYVISTLIGCVLFYNIGLKAYLILL